MELSPLLVVLLGIVLYILYLCGDRANCRVARVVDSSLGNDRVGGLVAKF